MKSADILFHLISVGLGNEDSFSFPQSVDWDELTALAKDQGVLAIACDGMMKLGTVDPSAALAGFYTPEKKPVKLAWYQDAMSREASYGKHRKAISDMAGYFSQNNIKTMVLKGYGLSLNYPVPSHRIMGDIDIWLYGKGKDADSLLKEKKVKVNSLNPHHSVFKISDLTVENHHYFMDEFAHKSNAAVDRILESMAAESIPVDVEGHDVFIPSANFNALYLTSHSGEHFAVENITLRHVLDWGLFVKRFSSSIDWEWLAMEAKNLGCYPFLSCICAVCVNYLGFCREDFKVEFASEKTASRMMGEILNPKFKGEIPNMKNRLRYYIVKTRRLIANNWKYRMVYPGNFFSDFFSLASNRVASDRAAAGGAASGASGEASGGAFGGAASK